VNTRTHRLSILGGSHPEREMRSWVRTSRPRPASEDEPVPDCLRRPLRDLEIVIPAWNEERRLPSTLHRTACFLEARPWNSAIVVVDNASADRTVDAVRAFTGSAVPVDVIGCSARGKGAAVRRGLLTSRADVLGFMDADLATPVETLDLVVPAILTGRADVIIASRQVRGSRFLREQPVGRRVGGAVFRVLAHHALPQVRDSQCGFKFFDGDLGRAVARQMHVDGFGFDIELLRDCIEFGAVVVEVPVDWTDVSGSSFHALHDGVRTAADIAFLDWSWHRSGRGQSA
jgi:dolichyl-phosphate beta-glucosyltransferase